MRGDFTSQTRSVIWAHFSKLPGGLAKCNICHNSYSYKGGGTANLRKHYMTKHPLVIIDETSPNLLRRATLQVKNEEIIEDGPKPSTSTQHSASDSSESEVEVNERKRLRTKKRSVVWEHFSKLSGEEARCNICRKNYSYKGGTTGNLRKHYRFKHPLVQLDEISPNLGQRLTLPVQKEEIVENALQSSTSTRYLENAENFSVSAVEVNGIKRIRTTKRSGLWLHFSKLPGEEASCNICRNNYSYKGGATGNLRKHYRLKHPLVKIDEISPNLRQRLTLPAEQEIDKDGPQFSTSMQHSASVKVGNSSISPVEVNGRKRKRMQTLSADVSRSLKLSRQHKINDLILNMIVKDFQPFSIIHDKGFLDLLRELEPYYKPPCKNTFVGSLLEDKYERNKIILKSLLEDTEFVTLTTDVWTSSTNEDYISVTAHFLTNKWELISCLLGCFRYNESDTAVNLCEQMKNIAHEFQIYEKIHVIVTENNANIVASANLTNWAHIPCLVHTLNVIVQHGLNLIKEIRDKVKEIVAYFHLGTDAHLKLLSTQTRMNPNCVPLKLKRDVSTRWISTFFMFERIVQLEEPLTVTVGLLHHPVQLLSGKEWKMLQEICKVLQPFEQISTEMSGQSSATISEVMLLVRGLTYVLHRYQAEMADDTTKNVIADLLESISERFSNIDYNTFFSKASLLDPRFKRKAFLNEEAYKKAKEMLQNEAVVHITKKKENSVTTDVEQPADVEENPTTADTIKIVWQEFDSENCITINVEPADVVQENEPADVVQENLTSADSIDLVWQEFDKSVALNIQKTSPTDTAIAEIRMYLEEPNISRHEDALAWWKARELLYPTLSILAKKHLCIVSTSVPLPSKVYSKAGQILIERRKMMKPEHVNKVLFLNCNSFLFNYKE